MNILIIVLYVLLLVLISVSSFIRSTIRYDRLSQFVFPSTHYINHLPRHQRSHLFFVNRLNNRIGKHGSIAKYVIPKDKESSTDLILNDVISTTSPSKTSFLSKLRLPTTLTVLSITSLIFFPSIVSYALPFESPRILINENWSRYFLAGGICCAISHTAGIPFDVVKTKKQTMPELEKLGVITAFQKIVRDDGMSVLSKGFGPTLIGYFIQGSLKYGFYEIFKPIIALLLHNYGGILGSSPVIGLMISAIMADFIGSLSLSPFEVARIKLVANPEYASNLIESMVKTSRAGGFGSLFSSFPMMLAKHLPYTAVQLSSYETITSSLYHILKSNGIVDLLLYRYIVGLVAASISAVLSTFASQPGDTLMTIINKSSSHLTRTSSYVNQSLSSSQSSSDDNVGMVMYRTAKSLGFQGLYVGTAARLLHVAIIVIVQLLVYDYIKEACGLPITGFSH